MVFFLQATALYLGLLALFAAPVVVIALRFDQRRTVRRFGWAVVGVGLVCGLLAAISRSLEQTCTDAGNTRCFDAGGEGLIWLILAGFLAVSLAKSYLIWTE